MITSHRIFKVFFSFSAAILFGMGIAVAVAGNWEIAVLFGIAAIVCSLWEIASELDILIAKSDAE